MASTRIQKAELLVAEGDKHMKTSMFKWAPDFDSAIDSYDKGNPFNIFNNEDETFLLLKKVIRQKFNRLILNFCSLAAFLIIFLNLKNISNFPDIDKP
jgi:hypothetical protein